MRSPRIPGNRHRSPASRRLTILLTAALAAGSVTGLALVSSHHSGLGPSALARTHHDAATPTGATSADPVDGSGRDASRVDRDHSRTPKAGVRKATPTTSASASAPRPSTSTSPTSPSSSTSSSSASPSSAAVAAPATSSAVTPMASSSGGACGFKPSALTVGAHGVQGSSGVTTLATGQSIANTTVDHLVITGNNVTVRNVVVQGSILVQGDNAMIDHVTAQGVSISSAVGTTVQYTNIGFGPGDGIHITSDRGRLVRNITLRSNYIHDPRVGSTAHYDGTQVRGVDGLQILCSVYDPGTYQHMYNAAVYLEDANGGDSNIVVARNWLYGFGFTVMMDARNTTLLSNRVGGDIHWGTCRLGTRTGNPGLQTSGNAWDASGASLALC